MSDPTTTPPASPEDEELERIEASMSEPENPRLDAWLRRTTTPLDLLALFTIWLTIIPIGEFHKFGGKPAAWYAARLALSFIYFIDMAVRTRLSHRRWHYLATHPLGIVAVIIPAVRLLFSLRLLTAMFRKGNLAHFLFVSLILLLNLTVIVFGFEHHASGSNITSLGVAIWWACVTIFTVGYGDYYPVTTGGRIFAVGIMALGLLTAAVITAQIASSFMDQAAVRRARQSAGGPVAPSGDESIIDAVQGLQRSLIDRLDALESHLHHGPTTAPLEDQT